MGELAIDQEAEPVGMSERGGFAGNFELCRRLGHTGQAKLAQTGRAFGITKLL
jgi:hypothetical protein